MKTRLGVIADIREKISERAPLVVEEQRKKLNERIESLLSETEIDRARLATEIALFADKVSIDEELVRLSSHIAAAGKQRLYRQKTGFHRSGDESRVQHHRFKSKR